MKAKHKIKNSSNQWLSETPAGTKVWTKDETRAKVFAKTTAEKLAKKVKGEVVVIDLQKCESCEKEVDINTMTEDADNNYFCTECWKELAPTLDKEYKDLVASGDIETE